MESIVQGDWVFGKRHGYGLYFYLDGGKYEGEVCTLWGQRVSRALWNGHLTASNHAASFCLLSQWVDDRIHGKGKSTYANGNVYEGEVCAIWL